MCGCNLVTFMSNSHNCVSRTNNGIIPNIYTFYDSHLHFMFIHHFHRKYEKHIYHNVVTITVAKR